MDKRAFLKTGAILGIGSLTATQFTFTNTLGFQTGENDKIVNDNGEYILPPLKYEYGALEPYIDAETMHLHHDIHHNGYVIGLNKAENGIKEAIEKNDYIWIKHLERELAFHGSGHFLHSIYWEIMGRDTGSISELLDKYIIKDFGSFEKFKSYFIAASKSVEGSGWGILSYQSLSDKLIILQAEKHQNLAQWINIPVMVVDVWEHAYYLKYKNKRKDYIEAFFNVINWTEVSNRFERIRG